MKGTCTQSPRPGETGQCIPGGTVILDSYFGNGTLPFISISTSVRGVQVYVSVTPGSDGTFIPISNTIANQGEYKLRTIGYFGYSDGIKDPSVFTIPKACYNTTQSEKNDEFHQMKRAVTDTDRIRISFL